MDWCRVFFVVIVALFCNLTDTCCLFNPYPRLKQIPATGGDVGQPLFVTPLIEAGKIKAARRLSNVENFYPDKLEVQSYAGYFTVNPTTESNLFFWFFPAVIDSANAPVLLWLQGGPGATSLFGLFSEIGPYVINHNQQPGLRKYYWSRNHSVLYIDNPVGTGFSFTKDDSGYARNQTDVGRDLYAALVQFFKMYPELQSNDFYVTGESYAGKYIPAIAYTIYRNNPTASLKINLKGIAIGNGLIDPEHMLRYSDYLYQLGLIDLHTHDVFRAKEDEGRVYIQNRQWNKAFQVIAFYAAQTRRPLEEASLMEANRLDTSDIRHHLFQVFDDLLNGDLTPYPSLFHNATGFDFYFNYLRTSDPASDDPSTDFATYIQSDDSRRALHVGSQPFGMSSKLVEQHLQQDVMKSVRSWLEVLLENYRVVIYNGQLDIIVAYPLTLGALRALNWSAAAEYANATRHKWYVDGQLAGYAKTAGLLTEVLVRNAGHMVPGDQPKWALDLVSRFTANKSFY